MWTQYWPTRFEAKSAEKFLGKIVLVCKKGHRRFVKKDADGSFCSFGSRMLGVVATTLLLKVSGSNDRMTREAARVPLSLTS